MRERIKAIPADEAYVSKLPAWARRKRRKTPQKPFVKYARSLDLKDSKSYLQFLV